MKKFWLVNQLTPSTAELLIYGYIGEEVIAGDFIRDLKELENQYANIHLRINSGGGSVYDGFAIYDAIRRSRAVIDTYIDGVCASMGTVIALAGRRIYMSKVATFMTHRATTAAFGSASDLRGQADMVEAVEESICSIYAKRTGLTKDEAKTKYLTNADRWLTAQQCLDEKLIDEIYDADATESLPVNAAANVLCDIYNKTLTPQDQNPSNSMKKIVLSLQVANILGFPATATTEGVEAPQLDAKINELNMRVSTAELAKTKAEQDLATFKSASCKGRVTEILAAALAGKKTTVALNAKLEKQYAEDPDGLQELINDMPAFQSVSDAIAGTKGQPGAADKFAGKTYDQLHRAGLVSELKATNQELFKQLYKDHYGKEYSGKF